MTDKNLTNNEIIKTLEGAILNAKRCDSKVWSIEIYKLENVLDLINRLQAEKEELVGNNDKLKAEIERLTNAYKQCAWERDVFAEDIKQEIKKDCSYLMLDIKNIKAEAYKEFTEKLKEFMHNKFKALDEYEFEYITERDINNLAKELVGDDNA